MVKSGFAAKIKKILLLQDITVSLLFQF